MCILSAFAFGDWLLHSSRRVLASAQQVLLIDAFLRRKKRPAAVYVSLTFVSAFSNCAAPEDVYLLSGLAVVDALLGRKQDAIKEAKRAVERLPISEDALNGPNIAANLATVYAWTGELDLAFEQLEVLTRIPNGVYYGHLKSYWAWAPLRKDPRFDKLLAELAPRD